MLRSLRDGVRRFRHHLTRLDDQPLSGATLVVIVFLDLFILFSLFDGLADHTRQLTAPEERVPPLCRDIVLDAEWNPTNRLERLARVVSTYHASYYEPDARDDRKPRHALCAPIVRAWLAIRDDEGLARALKESLDLRRETRELRAELERIKGAYDTTLLETLAGQRPGATDVGAIRKEMAGKTAALNERLRRQQLLEAALEQDPRVRALFALTAAVSDAERRALREELRRLNFWFPVERLGMELLFLLPLLAAFYYWNAKSIAARRPFQTLVSAHLLVVTLIPVFLKLLELAYDIIPRKLLKQVIELLESLKLVAIWHYLLMAAAIVATLALVYLFQKKLFSREKLLQRRIARGLCQDCGQRLPPRSRHCPACGAAQYRECGYCHRSTPRYGKHCVACGRGAG